MVWLVLDLLLARTTATVNERKPYAFWSLVLVALVYLMILSGALVAGTDAGFAYSTWPLMGDSFIPRGLYATSPAWLAMFEDITTIQFNHRMFAYALFVVLSASAMLVYRSTTQGCGRLAAIRPYLDPDEPFCFTYGDGVGDVDIGASIDYHRSHGRLATLTAASPPGRFGALGIEDGRITRFNEKPVGDGAMRVRIFCVMPMCPGHAKGRP